MLKTFKQFLEAKKTSVPIADYYPSHGIHSQEKYKKETPNKKEVPVADYYPSHGIHSMKEEVQKTMSYQNFISHNPNKNIHPTVMGVHEKLDPPKERWNKGLRNDERESVSAYTGSSTSSNKELVDTSNGRPSNFEHHPDDNEHTLDYKSNQKRKHKILTSGLDRLLNRSKVPRTLTVFHGINAPASENFNPGKLASQHPERHIQMPAYISSSIDPYISAKFARPEKYDLKGDKKPTTTHILKIKLKKGMSGFKYIGSHSEIDDESEGIIGRGKTLKIAEHPTVVHHPETGGHIHVWDAHVVD